MRKSQSRADPWAVVPTGGTERARLRVRAKGDPPSTSGGIRSSDCVAWNAVSCSRDMSTATEDHPALPRLFVAGDECPDTCARVEAPL